MRQSPPKMPTAAEASRVGGEVTHMRRGLLGKIYTVFSNVARKISQTLKCHVPNIHAGLFEDTVAGPTTKTPAGCGTESFEKCGTDLIIFAGGPVIPVSKEELVTTCP